MESKQIINEETSVRNNSLLNKKCFFYRYLLYPLFNQYGGIYLPFVLITLPRYCSIFLFGLNTVCEYMVAPYCEAECD